MHCPLLSALSAFSQYPWVDVHRGQSLDEYTKDGDNSQSDAKELRILSISADMHTTLERIRFRNCLNESSYGGYTTLLNPFRATSTLALSMHHFDAGQYFPRLFSFPMYPYNRLEVIKPLFDGLLFQSRFSIFAIKIGLSKRSQNAIANWLRLKIPAAKRGITKIQRNLFRARDHKFSTIFCDFKAAKSL